MTSIQDKILQASHRAQPYINLTNQQYEIREILDDKVIEQYNKINIKSLYFHVSKLDLNYYLGDKINKLINKGIREIFIFCDEESGLTKADFNSFLTKHKIYINTRIAQLSKTDIEQIKEDNVGAKDILGFEDIQDYQIVYRNNWKVSLLNSKESDKIILDNHQDYKHKISEDFEFGVKEPEYITSSDNNEVRITKIASHKKGANLESQLQLEVSQNIDVNIAVNEEVEQENELDIDQDQLANKLGFHKAHDYLHSQIKKLFKDHDLYYNRSTDSHATFSIISKIFSSGPNIKYITKKALDLILPHLDLFNSGINLQNMPIGLAYKDGIIFASENRPSSMPINGFTLNLKYITPTISNPLDYSWLYYATKGSISLSDVYGTDIAPKMPGYDDHPAISSDNISDSMLDIPFNTKIMKYNVDYRINKYTTQYHPDETNLLIKSQLNREELEGKFHGVQFFNLNDLDKERLNEIWNKLQERKLELFFLQFIKQGLNKDGGFLLEENTAVFLEKLFDEILPIPGDQHKIKFFQIILSHFDLKLLFTFSLHKYYLEDILEAADEAYNKLQEFFIEAKINDLNLQLELTEIFAQILKNQLQADSSFKISSERVLSILELNSKNGGNLDEQLQYLNTKEGELLVQDPGIYNKALEQNLNTLHNFINAKVEGFIHLMSVAPHQRASIDTYTKYYKDLTSTASQVKYSDNSPIISSPDSFLVENGCRPEKYPPLKLTDDLATIERSQNYLIKYPVRIYSYSGKMNKNFESQSYWSTQENIEKDLGTHYVLIKVINNQELKIIFHKNGLYKHLIFTESVPGGIGFIINYISNLAKDSGEAFGALPGEQLDEIWLYNLIDVKSHYIHDVETEESPTWNDLWDDLLQVFLDDELEICSIEDEETEKYTEEYEALTKKLKEANVSYKELVIGVDGKNFNIYQYYGDLVKRTDLILPDTLSERVKEWIEGDQKENLIYFSHEEARGTYIEDIRAKILSNTYKSMEKEAAGDSNKLREKLEQLEKNAFQEQCYAPYGVVSDDVNLVHNFTTNQAKENIALLNLNIVSSSGKYYMPEYPDQEFGSYLSLFNILFEKVKIQGPIKVGDWRLEVEEDFNKKTANIKESYSSASQVFKAIQDKEELHQKIINNFTQIYHENPEFKFGEIVALGLIENFLKESHNAIKAAKELHQYNGYFYQVFRILISNQIGNSKSDYEKLQLMVENFADKLMILVSKIQHERSSIKLHEFITESGNSPENLVFFASCLGQKPEITLDDTKELLEKINKLPFELKHQLVNSFILSKLPLANGTFGGNDNFPKLSIDILEDEELLNQIVGNAQKSYISYDFETRFNHISKTKLLNTKPDLSSIESKYGITFDQALKTKNFNELKKALLKDASYISNNINSKFLSKDVFEQIELAFVSEMFASISSREMGWQKLHNKSMDLLTNPTSRITQQISDIEYNKNNLDDILNSCKTFSEKEKTLDLLKMPQYVLQDLLAYLKSIIGKPLNDLGLSITEFLMLVPKNIYVNLPLFKVSTNFIIVNSSKLPIKEFYSLVEKVAAIEDIGHSFENILKYCHKNNDFSILDLISYLNIQSKNFDGVMNWLIKFKPEDLKKLIDNTHLEIKQLFKIIDAQKIKIVGEIAVEFGEKISKEQYSTIINHTKEYNLEHIKLLKSYFFAPNTAHISEQEKIKLIVDNLESLEKAQVLFSQENFPRFHYDQDRLISKILEISHKTGSEAENDLPLMLIEQKEIYKCFITVMEYGQNFIELNGHELLNKSLELKHMRLLSKENDPCFIRNLDLEFIALIAEVMLRETGKFPRDTQILSVLNSFIHEGHLIEEIATGQGKSIIAALHAAYLWFCGQTVDVVTSSRVLGERDIQDFAPFYDALGIDHSPSIITPTSSLEEYRKGGVNYALASDLALFRADREFHSNKHDLSLNTDVSIICDEIDAILTSSVNYKLALPLINTNQEETRVLFKYILDFTDSNTFKNTNISYKDDIENLKLFLNYQFEKYDSSLHFPLNAIQLNKLQHSEDPKAQTLYTLNKALVKCQNDEDKLFDKLLDSTIIAKSLEKGVHFVVLNLDNQDENLLKAIPIIKDQPSRETVFGDGVQVFLHLLLERTHPEWNMKFEMHPPTSTIFNVSPKNFFDYYRLTDGRIIGLTGTAGSKVEIDEFRSINKIAAFSIPKFEQDKKLVLPDMVVKNLDEQQTKTLEIIKEFSSNRPVLIFCESTKHAEEVYKTISSQFENVQLCASSNLDTSSVIGTVAHAGKNGTITITTPMLGRGTDFFTTHPEGYFAINLCTDITYSGLLQIYGRIARNGDQGSVVSIFNHDNFAENIESPHENMDLIATEEKDLRLRSQPLTDVLKYFANVNQDNTFTAILTNEFITNAWKNLLAKNDKLLAEERKSPQELRENLVKIVKAQYPETSANLDSYLELIDSAGDHKMEYKLNNELNISNITNLIQPYVSTYSCNAAPYNLLQYQIFKDNAHNVPDSIPVFTQQSLTQDVIYLNQSIPGIKVEYDEEAFVRMGVGGNMDKYWQIAHFLAAGITTTQLGKPISDAGYHAFYENVIQMNNAKVLTHTFTLTHTNLILSFSYNYKFKVAPTKKSIKNLKFNEIALLASENGDSLTMYLPITQDNNQYQFISESELKDLKIFDILLAKVKLYKNTVLAKNHSSYFDTFFTKINLFHDEKLPENYLTFNRIEEKEVQNNLSSYLQNSFYMSGEGSNLNLMLNEFKSSFAAYRKTVNSVAVNKIGDMIENYGAIEDLDLTKLEPGKFQAINIVTKFTSSSSHAESILTDGKFLLWINRGGGSEGNSGIRIFKIIKSIEKVKSVLNDLKTAKPQAETRQAIYSLLRDDNNENIPKHALVPMSPQKIGNCGWVQTESMIVALGLVKYISVLEDLPDIKSSTWQKVVKDAEDIYNDFTIFDHMMRAEAVLYSIDQFFEPKFLDEARKIEIDEIKKYVNEPITNALLQAFVGNLRNKISEYYTNTIYKDQFYTVLNQLRLETEFGSKIGLALERASNATYAKSLLTLYQSLYKNFDHSDDFDDIEELFFIKYSKALDQKQQDKIFLNILEFVIEQNIYIEFYDELANKFKNATDYCQDTDNLSEDCIIQHFKSSYLNENILIEEYNNPEVCYKLDFLANNFNETCPLFIYDGDYNAEMIYV